MENRLDFRFEPLLFLLLLPLAAGFFIPSLAIVLLTGLPFLAQAVKVRKGPWFFFASLVIPFALFALRWRYPLLLSAGMAGYLALLALAMAADKDLRPFKARLAIYAAAFLLGLMGFVPFLSGLDGTPADVVIRWVSESERCNDVLIALYQQGLVRVDDSLISRQQVFSNLSYQLLGSQALLPAVRSEMLNSLRTTVELLLPNVLPTALVLFSGIGALMMAMLPVALSRREGKPIKSPEAFEKWRLDRQMQGLLLWLLPGYFFRYFTANATALLMGEMMSATAQLLLAVQGVAVIASGQKKRGASRFSRRLWCVVITVFFYQVPVFIGLIDQFADFRGLRPKNKEDA